MVAREEMAAMVARERRNGSDGSEREEMVAMAAREEIVAMVARKERASEQGGRSMRGRKLLVSWRGEGGGVEHACAVGSHGALPRLRLQVHPRGLPPHKVALACKEEFRIRSP